MNLFMKKIITALFLVMAGGAFAQTNPLLGQYLQNIQFYNPAMTGMNNATDINLGLRRQWAGFQGSPSTSFLSVNARLNSGANLRVNQGVGGYVMSSSQGPYKQTEVALMYAVHVPIARDVQLSLGASPNIYSSRVDLSSVWVKDLNDATYQNLLMNGTTNTYFHLNLGMSLYATNYFVSYSLSGAANAVLAGNKLINETDNQMRHQVMAGYRFYLANQVELMPNTFVRIDPAMKTFWEAGLRARFQEKYWVGASWRNDNTWVGMLGFTFQDKYRIGYAFEYKTQGITNYNNGTHEINIGMRVFNHAKTLSMW